MIVPASQGNSPLWVFHTSVRNELVKNEVTESWIVVSPLISGIVSNTLTGQWPLRGIHDTPITL